MPESRLVPPTKWPTLGDQIVSWIEYHLCHGPGDIMGEALGLLDDEWFRFILDCYRLYPKTHRSAGRRVVAHAELSRSKGRAKSELAGMLVCVEFIGPCRFDHWAKTGEVSYWGYRYKRGEPVGRPLVYPFIRCLATEETQTGNTYDNVKLMLKHAAERWPKRWGHLRVMATGTYLGEKENGEIRPSSAGSASKDGGKETFAVADEDHLYTLPELREMYDTVSQNCRKRKAAQPWLLSTTTQFEPGAGSVAEDNRRAAEELIALGHQRKRHGFCFDHREGFPVKDWDDDEEILNSLREAYGAACEWMDLEGILHEEIRRPGKTRERSERFFLNRAVQGESKAIDPDQWDARAKPLRTPGPGQGVPILIAFDGSDGGEHADDTALVGWTVERVPHLFLIERWRRPPTAGRTYRVPRGLVRKRVSWTKENYDVRRFVADPPGWRDEIDGPSEGWVKEFGDAPTGPKREMEPIVREFHTNKAAQMGPAVDRFLEALAEGTFTHDGSDDLRQYALNALLVKAKGAGNFSALGKPGLDDKIDGLVAAVIGYDELADLPVPKKRNAAVHSWDEVLAELATEDEEEFV